MVPPTFRSDHGKPGGRRSTDFAAQKIFAKCDYDDLKKENGSEDPADPAKTGRVWTIMLATKY
jgi:hypothetical protein